jgi:hypothetical protein
MQPVADFLSNQLAGAHGTLSHKGVEVLPSPGQPFQPRAVPKDHPPRAPSLPRNVRTSLQKGSSAARGCFFSVSMPTSYYLSKRRLETASSKASDGVAASTAYSSAAHNLTHTGCAK